MSTNLSERIQKILTEKKLKKTDFAKSLGISSNYVYSILSGRKTHISETLAKLIENVYEYPAQWVMYGEESSASSFLTLQEQTIKRIKQMQPEELLQLASFIHSLGTEPTH